MNITRSDCLFISIDTSSSLSTAATTVTITFFMNTISSPTGIYVTTDSVFLNTSISLYQLIEIFHSSSTTVAVTITFLLAAIFTSILTVVLTLLFVYVYNKRIRFVTNVTYVLYHITAVFCFPSS